MNNIDQILDNLKGQQPIIGDANQLTDSIMNRIDQPSDSRRHITIALVVRTALSAAAIWLIGLLIYQTSFDSEPQNTDNQNIAYQIDNLQRISARKNAYANRQEVNAIKTISYIQLKKIYYENH
ncbi:MAG: hypothetical protein J6U04_04530 [Salinivirgaceae bacterium]|nr:hypothetical protein [Salinivirgaceae bacterium]